MGKSVNILHINSIIKAGKLTLKKIATFLLHIKYLLLIEYQHADPLNLFHCNLPDLSLL